MQGAARRRTLGRRSPRLWPAGRGAQLIAVAFFVLAPALLGVWVFAIAPLHSDFALYYRDARVGWEYGWAHMYDLAGFRAVTHQLGIHNQDPDVPSLSVPLLTWLVAPFALLPFPVAYAAWMVTMLAAALTSWRLLAPSTPFGPYPHLLLAAVFLPFVWGVTEGSGLVIAVFGIAAGWYWLRRDHPIVAGLLFCFILVRPQVCLLIPVCLLAAGRRRLFATFAAGAAVLGLMIVLVVPVPELEAYLARVVAAAQHPKVWQVANELSLASVRPAAAALALVLAISTLAIVASYRARRSEHRDELAIIAGIVGSLLGAPYLHIPDLALMLVAVWLALRLVPAGWWPAVVLPVTFGANLAVSLGSVLPAAIEVVWLLVLVFGSRVPDLLLAGGLAEGRHPPRPSAAKTGQGGA